MADPASFAERENWYGGHYELALELGLRRRSDADAALLRGLAAIWREPDLDGPYPDGRSEPEDQVRTEPVPRDMAEPGHLYGQATLPTGATIVCGTCVSRQRGDDGVDWLILYLPMGALDVADERVGAHPFPGPVGAVSSRTWREPIDAWLAAIALRVRAAVEFRVGVIGHEASAPGDPWDGDVPDVREIGYVVPTGDSARFLPANRWDSTWS